jgi:REP element-mobilizing transposase RayT
MPINRRIFRNELKSRQRLLVKDASAVYHVMSRTACQAFLFNAEAKEVFKSLIRKQADFSGLEILTFCIMDNHFHLLIRVPAPSKLSHEALLERYKGYYGVSNTPQSTYSVTELREALEGDEATIAYERVSNRMGNLPAFIRELKQRFSIWYNNKHSNQGTIWSARYKSLLVEDSAESLTKVAAYIDLNPVRADIVSDPQDYRWCGYAEAVAGIQIAKDGIKSLFHSLRDARESIKSYRLVLFGKGYESKGNTNKDFGRISEQRVKQIEKNSGDFSLQEILRARVRYFSDGMALGSQEFIESSFNENRSLFGKNRRQGGHKIKGSSWGELCVIRNLRKRIYS